MWADSGEVKQQRPSDVGSGVFCSTSNAADTIFYLDKQGNILDSVMTDSGEIVSVKFDVEPSSTLVSIENSLISKVHDKTPKSLLQSISIEGGEIKLWFILVFH